MAAPARPGLVLTLHGAAVEASGQAACFAPKSWVHVVAPTNRRPYGFDGEDWGRLDAMEVLDLTQKELGTDSRKTYLTGHSMGGHGTWHLGVTYPDRFAAIGPSAAWISMWSYAGARRPENPDPIQEMFLRSSLASDTLALSRNFAQEGVFMLHGDRDDNVPVGQARTMMKHLADFHRDLVYFEQPGAGHWWGNPCVDWPPMFEFFARHTLPAPDAVHKVDFFTASPVVSAWCHWAGIEAQMHAFKVSSVHLNYDPGKRAFTGTTDNVARLALDLGHLQPGKPIQVELDRQKLEQVPWPSKDRRLWLVRRENKWIPASRPAPVMKNPGRSGPFKEAFRNRVLFVYGTTGTAEENAWALARARYDAETFYYRGNASVDVIADHSFHATAEPDRNVILYGHAESNSAWNALLSESPVQVGRGKIQIGDREEKGDDLACLFVRPRPGSDRALVGVVAGAGLPGMHMTEHLPYFVSGVAYPDCVVVGADTLLKGAAGNRVAGFFGEDWGVASGEFAFRN
jgi:pimeloyl-ACP methyl ester carboxylesterase